MGYLIRHHTHVNNKTKNLSNQNSAENKIITLCGFKELFLMLISIRRKTYAVLPLQKIFFADITGFIDYYY